MPELAFAFDISNRKAFSLSDRGKTVIREAILLYKIVQEVRNLMEGAETCAKCGIFGVRNECLNAVKCQEREEVASDILQKQKHFRLEQISGTLADVFYLLKERACIARMLRRVQQNSKESLTLRDLLKVPDERDFNHLLTLMPRIDASTT